MYITGVSNYCKAAKKFFHRKKSNHHLMDPEFASPDDFQSVFIDSVELIVDNTSGIEVYV